MSEDCRIQTYTGRWMHPIEPRPEDLDIEDIAHSLSMLCRFGGHTRRFYSVAEHSLLASSLVDEKHALAALLHDASEAYLVDVPRPIKRFSNFGDLYRGIEDRLMMVIAGWAGFCFPLDAAVIEVDNRLLDDEQFFLMPQNNDADYDRVYCDVLTGYRNGKDRREKSHVRLALGPHVLPTPQYVEHQFVQRFRYLSSKRHPGRSHGAMAVDKKEKHEPGTSRRKQQRKAGRDHE